MHVAVIGISGNAGSRIARELLSRGHVVTGIARTVDTDVPDGVALQKGDATKADELANIIKGHDAVFSAARFASVPADGIIAAVKEAQVSRLLVVGGAASLLGPDGQRLIDSPDFPDAYRPEGEGGIRFLDALKRSSGIEWTFLRPSAEFVLGERTGIFRLGEDHLLVDENGRSWISYEDLAIALVDELENPRHAYQAYTIGY